jgi:uncharacterized membrane protein
MRYWEIDFIRGIAVLMMIAYHFIFDLFFQSHIGFEWLAVPIASTFILVSGISLNISYSKGGNFEKFAKRGIKLLAAGGLITVASFLFLREGYILFGIIHFFGVSSFLVYPFLKHSKKLAMVFLGISAILLGLVFLSTNVAFGYLLWLGLTPPAFFTFDFFPIFPWFGLLLVGAYVGNSLYPNGKRGSVTGSFATNEPDNYVSKTFQFWGRNSLVVYFVHQPIIFLLLYFSGSYPILSLMAIG